MAVRCNLLLLALVFVIGISGCAVRVVTPIHQAVAGDDLDLASLRHAVRQSLAYLRKLPPERGMGELPRPFTALELLDGLNMLDGLLGQDLCRDCLAAELATRFMLLPSSGDESQSDILFTGYYQPVIDASSMATDDFRFPIYGTPEDLVSREQANADASKPSERATGRVENDMLIPYYSRHEIDALGALSGRGLEIAWVRDPIDLFFLHIQGAGLLRFTDGREVTVGYAAQNGRPYRSIGRLLIDQGKLTAEEVSMQRLRRYLTEHPGEQSEIFAHNESYVFFRLLDGGPLGSLGVPVTAGRTIATDSRLFPRGALALIESEIPVIGSGGELAGWRPVTRLVLNQDTGGAIRGPQRVDYYFGTGDEAGALAGYMNRRGRLYFLVPRSNKN